MTKSVAKHDKIYSSSEAEVSVHQIELIGLGVTDNAISYMQSLRNCKLPKVETRHGSAVWYVDDVHILFSEKVDST